LNFDYTFQAHFERAPRTLLAEHGEVYRAQLIAARSIAAWRERLLKPGGAPGVREEYIEGYVRALGEIVAHLHQGDYLPGGSLYEEEMGATPNDEA
jgi:hypothetical protein